MQITQHETRFFVVVQRTSIAVLRRSVRLSCSMSASRNCLALFRETFPKPSTSFIYIKPADMKNVHDAQRGSLYLQEIRQMKCVSGENDITHGGRKSEITRYVSGRGMWGAKLRLVLFDLEFKDSAPSGALLACRLVPFHFKERKMAPRTTGGAGST